MPATTEGGAAPTGECPRRVKVRFFVVLYNNFAMSLHYHNMSFTCQITQDRISDAINVYTMVITQIPQLRREHLG